MCHAILDGRISSAARIATPVSALSSHAGAGLAGQDDGESRRAVERGHARLDVIHHRARQGASIDDLGQHQRACPDQVRRPGSV